MQWVLPRMTTPMENKLAAFIRQAREQRGWTMRQLEDYTGISKTALQSMVEGKTKVPVLENLDRLAQVFNVSLGYLVELCGFKINTVDLRNAPGSILTPEQLQFLADLTPQQRADLLEFARKMRDQNHT